MDFDFWASRIHSGKHLSAVQASRHCSEDEEYEISCVGADQLSKRPIDMTNYTEDAKAQTEERNSEDNELDDLLWDISNLQKPLEELKARISNEKFNFSRSNSNLSTRPYVSCALRNRRESQTKPKANGFDFSSKDVYGDAFNDEKSICENSSGEDHHLAIDDSDGDDDKKACFPCPFCYVDIDIHVLCSHLEDEHCFDLKNAVCPLCAANLGKNVTAHFMVQHSSSLKHKKRTQKSGLWVGSSVMLGKELSSFLGSSTNGRANALESASDLFLSSFLSSVSLSDDNGSQQVESSNKSSSTNSHSKSTEISLLGGSNELANEERRQRVAFVQQLIASTIL